MVVANFLGREGVKVQKHILSLELDTVMINQNALVWAVFDHFWQKWQCEEADMFWPWLQLVKGRLLDETKQTCTLPSMRQTSQQRYYVHCNPPMTHKYPGMQQIT